MTYDLDTLTRLAQAATPGERCNSYHPPSGVCHIMTGQGVLATIASHRFPNKVVEDGDFIAACSPDVILALVARVRKLEEALELCKVQKKEGHMTSKEIKHSMPDCPRCGELEKKLDYAQNRWEHYQEQVSLLEAALKAFGQHHDDCHLRVHHDSSSFCLSAGEHGCTCGLTLTLRGAPDG